MKIEFQIKDKMFIPERLFYYLARPGEIIYITVTNEDGATHYLGLFLRRLTRMDDACEIWDFSGHILMTGQREVPVKGGINIKDKTGLFESDDHEFKRLAEG